MKAHLADRFFDAARAFRFGLVGITGTLTYLALVNLLAVPIGPLTPFTAHLVGLTLSIGVSYAGHHAFTFGHKGRHRVYLFRFAVTTAVLFVVVSAVAYVADRVLGLPAALISVLVTVIYPPLSYLTHTLWTFAEAKSAERVLP
jgi:putative flippase GtrA